MTWPMHGIFTNNISSITGTADSTLSGTQFVEIKITSNPVTGPWWDGNQFVFTETWRQVTVTGGTW